VNVEATPIAGVMVLRSSPSVDERGTFVRTFDRAALAAAGLVVDFPEHSISTNVRRGTVRGLHLQRAPHEETKVVRCVRGRIWDVVVDLRPTSPTRGRWHAEELDGSAATALYVPVGIAHGFQTLEDDSAVHYLISSPYVASAATGVRWDDPTLGIEWPEPPSVISARDLALPAFDSA
jgi:dTDP-4-dehydrorhamnose 3,5-epimerase